MCLQSCISLQIKLQSIDHVILHVVNRCLMFQIFICILSQTGAIDFQMERMRAGKFVGHAVYFVSQAPPKDFRSYGSGSKKVGVH